LTNAADKTLQPTDPVTTGRWPEVNGVVTTIWMLKSLVADHPDSSLQYQVKEVNLYQRQVNHSWSDLSV